MLFRSRYFYHFGGVADINEAREKPFEAVEANVMGVATAMDVGRTVRVERVLYASTMYVYSTYGSFYRASRQIGRASCRERV